MNSFCCGFCMTGSHYISFFGLKLTLYTRLSLPLHPLLPLKCWDYRAHHNTLFPKCFFVRVFNHNNKNGTRIHHKRKWRIEMLLDGRRLPSMKEVLGFTLYCKENKQTWGGGHSPLSKVLAIQAQISTFDPQHPQKSQV